MGKIKQSVRNFTKYNNLMYELVKKNIKLKYRRSYLGILWTLIEPLLTMIVLTVVFGTFFNKGTKQFPVYVLTGRLLFAFFQSSTKAGLKAVSGNASMIKKVYVPKYIYVLSSVLSNFLIFLISLIVLVGVGIVLKVEPSIYLLEAWIPLLVLLVMSMGTSLILATLSVFFRDIEYIWGVLCMLVMYASAIFYPVERIIKSGKGWVFNFNPVYMCIANFRNSVLYGVPMDMKYLVVSAAISAVLLLFGIFVFYKKQDDFILYL